MDLTPEMIEQLKADLKKARTYQDLMGENGAIKKIIKASLEGMLDAELTEHLGYEKYSPEGRGSGNNRNDKTHKTLKNDNGEIDITVPRDRNGSFDPLIVKKYERTLGPIKVIDLAKEWHNRPLESIYPIVFFDAIHYKVTSEGKVTNKAAYTCLSLNIDGRKDLLGLWVSEAEGANFWLTVLTELKNRGVQDILIACVDGLKGFPEAINTVFPKTEI